MHIILSVDLGNCSFDVSLFGPPSSIVFVVPVKMTSQLKSLSSSTIDDLEAIRSQHHPTVPPRNDHKNILHMLYMNQSKVVQVLSTHKQI